MAEIVNLIFAYAAFQKCTRINSRRRVALKVNEIARLVAVAGMEKMVEPNFQQGSQRRIGRDVATDSGVLFILPMDHRHGIPTNQALEPTLDLAVTRVGNLVLNPNGVGIRSVVLDGEDFDVRVASMLGECLKQCRSVAGAVLADYLVESFNPLSNFVEIGRCLGCTRRIHTDKYALK